jgi:hypothetical protein
MVGLRRVISQLATRTLREVEAGVLRLLHMPPGSPNSMPVGALYPPPSDCVHTHAQRALSRHLMGVNACNRPTHHARGDAAGLH